MKTVIKFLQKFLSPLPLIATLCLIFAAIVYFFGTRIGMRGIYPFRAESTREFTAIILVSIAALLLLIIIVRAILAWRKNRAVKEKKEPSEEEKAIKALDKLFEKSLKVMRKNWTGPGRGIYGLPWYLVIGSYNSGKSSLIDNSDLRFPIDHELSAEQSEFSASEAFDVAKWRVAGREAVLLDVNALYFDDHDEHSSVQQVLWRRFLVNLQKARPRRPINGVILTIDIVDFLGMSLARREKFAMMTRRTINDMIEQLGTRMTIHVVFTKMDQLAGFSDYFENLSATERERLFGFHFLYQGSSTPDWFDQFSDQYNEFITDLQAHLKKRTLDLKNPESRKEAFSFFRSFLGLEAPLKNFLEIALAADRFTTPPLVRGIYFGSNRQENAPRNVFLEAIGQRYALPAPLYGTSQAASFPYFLPRVMKSAIFPEAGLSGNNRKVETRYRTRLAMVAILGVIACGGGWLYWGQKYNTNLQQAEVVLNKSRSFASSDTQTGADATGQQYLEPLSQIRSATFEFGNYREVGAIPAKLTLYKGHKIGPIADKAYRAVLNDQFAPTLVEGVETELENVCPKGSDQELNLLRVYRMLGDIEGRDNRVIQQYFRNLWQAEFEQDATKQTGLTQHLDYMLTNVPAAYEVDAQTVRASQRNITKLSPYRRVYSSLRSLAERQMPSALSLGSSVGAAFDISYIPNEAAVATSEQNASPEPADGCGVITEKTFKRGPFEIPRLFTKEKYFDFFIPQNERVARVVADDLWVLGQFETTQFSEADYDVIKANVRENYVDDYIRVWRQSLNAMEIRQFKDIRDATEVLRALSGSDMPIRRVAQLVKHHTVIYDSETQLLSGDEASQSELPVDGNRLAGIKINEAFREIHLMLEEQVEGGAANVDQIQEALINLYDYLKTVRDASDPNAKALELAINRAKLTGEDPIFVMKRLSERAPAPFDVHLRRVAEESWKVIMVAATEELNRKWHEEIYGAYKRLIEGKYPFDRDSENDLPIDDFIAFFAPDGILADFYNRELLTFVDEVSGTPKVIDGESLAVDKDFAKRLKDAVEITRSYFNASNDLEVEFTATPVRLASNLSRAVLNFEGQLISSSHGPSRPITIIWPNIIDGPTTSRVDLAPLIGRGRTYSVQKSGPWSWLRLYDHAGKSSLADTSVNIVFANQNGQEAVFNIRPNSRVNAFFNSPLSEFSLPSHVRQSGS